MEDGFRFLKSFLVNGTRLLESLLRKTGRFFRFFLNSIEGCPDRAQAGAAVRSPLRGLLLFLKEHFLNLRNFFLTFSLFHFQ